MLKMLHIWFQSELLKRFQILFLLTECQMRIILTTIFLLLSVCANAAIPTCHENSDGNYCTYKGSVERIYINSSGMILIYFDAQLPIETAGAVGISISSGVAGAYLLSNNPDFAKILYS